VQELLVLTLERVDLASMELDPMLLTQFTALSGDPDPRARVQELLAAVSDGTLETARRGDREMMYRDRRHGLDWHADPVDGRLVRVDVANWVTASGHGLGRMLRPEQVVVTDHVVTLFARIDRLEPLPAQTHLNRLLAAAARQPQHRAHAGSRPIHVVGRYQLVFSSGYGHLVTVRRLPARDLEGLEPAPLDVSVAFLTAGVLAKVAANEGLAEHEVQPWLTGLLAQHQATVSQVLIQDGRVYEAGNYRIVVDLSNRLIRRAMKVRGVYQQTVLEISERAAAKAVEVTGLAREDAVAALIAVLLPQAGTEVPSFDGFAGRDVRLGGRAMRAWFSDSGREVLALSGVDGGEPAQD
jgi:hypothetical protein